MVKDTVKIHAMNKCLEYHSIYFTNFDIHITLFLHGVFSYFSTSKKSLTKLEVKYYIQLMNSEGTWNPRSYVYVKSEEIIMDW